MGVRCRLMEHLTLTLQKSKMPQIQGIEGEAVVLYAEPLITQEMRYPRLSRRVNNRTNQERFNDATFGGFQIMGHKARESPTYLGFLQASSCYLCNIRVYKVIRFTREDGDFVFRQVIIKIQSVVKPFCFLP